MKVNSNRDISFKSIYTNKALKKTLEFASDNGALFAASAALGFSALRPVSIWLTPNTEKENRKLAILKSLTSSMLGFCIMLGISRPVSKAIQKIDKNPKKYLSKDTINELKDKKEELTNSKGYIFATQLFKLGLGAIIAVPKALLTASGTAFAVNKVDLATKNNDSKSSKKNINFKSNRHNMLSKLIGKAIDKKPLLNLVNKFKDTNFPMHIVAGTDAISTAVFINSIHKKENIEEKRKKTLMYNAGISTTLCITGGYTIDKILNKPVEKFIHNYKMVNTGKPNLDKQIQGIKIAKPIVILGTIYYILIPIISTFMAELISKKSKNYNSTNTPLTNKSLLR